MTRLHLADRVVVITGGTGGFARALAPALTARGARVALLDLDAEAAAAAAAELGPSERTRGWRADVRDLAHLQDTMDQVAGHFGGIDVVLANAGLGDVAVLLHEDDPGHWDAMVDINLNGVYRTFRAAYPHVLAAHGHLLATSSMAAFIHSPLQGAYTATKAGVWALCDSWRLEARGTGVTVGSLHPTFFRTPMTEQIWADHAGHRLWGGNTRGLWKQVDIDVVVRATIRGIERRTPHVVAPRALRPAALAPGLLQSVVDRIGFPGTTIEDAVALVRAAESRRS
jgi:NAD(P)-dependent dehydrogenase (short-subunit alcohol dehydrogenase family)